MTHIWRVIRFVPEYRGRICAVLAVGTLLALIGTGTPYIYKLIVDVIARLLAGQIDADVASRHVAWLVGGFFALRVGVVVCTAVQQRQADDLWLDTVSTFRQRVFDNMTGLSIDYFEKTRAGEIMDRFGTITSITMWLSTLTEGMLANLLQVTCIVVVLLVRSPTVGVVMTLVLAFNLYLSWKTVRRAQPYRRGWQAMVGKMTGLLGEMIVNIATVRSFGGEPAVKQRYDDAQATWKVTRDQLHRLEWKSSVALNAANTLGVFAAVSLTAWGVLHGRYTTGDILLVLTLSQSLVTNIGPIARLLNQAGDIEVSAERLTELFDIESETTDSPTGIDVERLESLEFQHVDFRYPGKDDLALQDVSFTLLQGQSLALVGPSGGGKTTVVKLLMRFYEPTGGMILLNGRDIREYRQRSIRGLLGVVLQDVALFNDSIEENIGFAKAGATEDEVRAAACAAHADDFIARLPQGYETRVGERGIKLSGGEKQRLAIARAILKNPQLIVLDEATSALDSESEVAVQKGLQRLLANRSSLIIAHRLSTVMKADQILVIQHGRVQERGRHADLVTRRDGLYARLVAIQTRQPLPSMAAG